MPICIKKWWQHWPAHTCAMLACGHRFIKLTCATWHECLHYVDGWLQIDKTRCLECCANGLCCLWNVCSAHQVMQTVHMLHAICILSGRARWGSQDFVLHLCSTSCLLSSRSSPWNLLMSNSTVSTTPGVITNWTSPRLSFLKSGASNKFLVWAAQLCLIYQQVCSMSACTQLNLPICLSALSLLAIRCWAYSSILSTSTIISYGLPYCRRCAPSMISSR